MVVAGGRNLATEGILGFSGEFDYKEHARVGLFFDG